MTVKMKRFPRGYLCVEPNTPLGNLHVGTEILTTAFDAELDNLYKIRIGRLDGHNSWAFKLRVIICVARLFRGFERWLRLQAEFNDNVYDLNWSFLEDTVRFIRGKPRIYPLQNWIDLLREHPDERVGSASPRRYRDLQMQAGEFSNYVGMWVTRENGFDDMLSTAYVLFGQSKTPIENHM